MALPNQTNGTPGVYIKEVQGGARPIEAVGTSTVGFVGTAPDRDAHVNQALFVENFQRFARLFAGASKEPTPLALAVRGFFDNGGSRCCVVNDGGGSLTGGDFGRPKGLEVLETIDEVAVVCLPGRWDIAAHSDAIAHCSKLRDRVAILDAPPEIVALEDLTKPAQLAAPDEGAAPLAAAGGTTQGAPARPPTSDEGYAAFYFPWLRVSNPFGEVPGGDKTKPLYAPPSGHVAGIYARTDATRGVHKAPANEVVRGVLGLRYDVTAESQGNLNLNGVNVIRNVGGAPRVWGARTLSDSASQWRYINVRRTFVMIEESIARGTGWVVFEPNDETLWKSIRRDVGAFLSRIYRSGALLGRTPEEAFYVKCDAENNPPDSIDAGFVIVEVGIAVVKPAEFIVFQIGQHSAGSERTGGANG